MAIVVTPQTTTLPNGFTHTGDAEDDVFTPTDQADTFIGGGGLDRVSYAAAPGRIVATLDPETPVVIFPEAGWAAGDVFDGIAEIEGTGFDDRIRTFTTSATLFGGDGLDFLDGGSGNDVLYGGDGDDQLTSFDGGNDTLFGGAGDDVALVLDPGMHVFYGGSGDDDFYGSTAGQVTLFGEEGADTLRGSQGDDVIDGGTGSDDLEGDAGDDVITGGEGRDSLIGGDGNDTLYGGESFDFLSGQTGNDRLYGGGGLDVLEGGDGNDLLDGGFGIDQLMGGLGNDTYVINQAFGSLDNSFTDFVREDFAYADGGGIDTVVSYSSHTLGDNFEILRLVGNFISSGAGNDADNVLVGSNYTNGLTGGGGNDRILGKDGHDILTGNSGADTLEGGAGLDTFVFLTIADSRAGAGNRDFINGFEHYADKIDLSAIDANTANGMGDDAFDWIGADQFGGLGAASAGQLRYMSLTAHNALIIEGDHNGDGVADFQILVNGTDFMSVADFLF